MLDVQAVGATDTFDQVRQNDNLSDADDAVLALADESGGTPVMDEEYGRNVAKAESIRTRGTAYLVLRLLEEGVLDADEAKGTIDAMLEAGWYCAPNLYARVLGKIDELA